MSIFIPPNNQPESVVISNTSYTIPSGKFARVTLQARAWAAGYISLTGSGATLDSNVSSFNSITQDSDSNSITLYLPSGSAISSSTQSASDTDSGVNTTAQLLASGTSYVNITVDGSVVLSVFASGTCYCKNSASDGSNYYSATVTGSVAVNITAELFSEIS